MAFGVYVKFGEIPDNVPFTGCVPTTYVRLSPSISVPCNVITKLLSSSKVSDCATASGVSLMGLTTMLISTLVESTVPSLATKLKLSAPW